MKKWVRATYILLLIVAIIATIGLVALTNFDLNRYRPELQQTLQNRLGVPVKLGETKLTLHHGIMLDFSDSVIGSEEDRISAKIPHLLLQLKIGALLRGDYQFRQIRALQPHVRVHLPANTEPLSVERLEASASSILSKLGNLEVEQLEVTHGQLFVTHHDQAAPIKITQINGRIHDWTQSTPGQLLLLAQWVQPEGVAQLRCEAQLPKIVKLKDWRTAPIQLTATAQPIHLTTSHYTEITTLQLDISGVPATGVQTHLQAELVADKTVHPLTAKVDWQVKDRVHTWENLSVQLADHQLTGQLTLLPEPVPRLVGQLNSTELPTEALSAALFPEGSVQQMIGHLEDLRVQLNGPIPQTLLQTLQLVEQAQAKLAIDKVIFPPAPPMTSIRGEIHYDPQRLSLGPVSGIIGDQPVRLNAQVENLSSDQRKVSGRLQGGLDLAALAQSWPDFPSEWRMTGVVPFTGTIDGDARLWVARLAADFDTAQADMGVVLQKQPKTPGKLRATLSSDGKATAAVDLADMKFRASGRYDQPSKILSVAVAPFDLIGLRTLSPIFEEMRFRGKVAATTDVKLTDQGPLLSPVQLDLDRIGFHLWNAVADFDEISGPATLDGTRFELPRTEVRWGRSNVSVAGIIPDLRNTRATLKARADRLWADSIVFPSPTARFEKVKGEVIIGLDGIELHDIHARMPGGTRAVVNGTIRDFRSVKTSIQVNAQYGNIDEAIDMFIGPEKKRTTKESTAAKHPIVVDVLTQKGHLGDLKFGRAQGRVHVFDRRLRVEPLIIDTNPGRIDGRVVYDYHTGPPHRLEIGGKVERINADAIYRDLLHEKGLITGALTGTFSLEGRGLGKAFLASSDGAFQARIERGVLRQFNSLSKVFSILNVSQIFKGNLLPDMNLEGMPFNHAEASVSLKKGVLSTENLRVDSEAMNLSLVGDIDLNRGQTDLVLAVKPLVTVDRVITRVPVVGWLLTGQDKSLVTAHFEIKGDRNNPNVTAIPATSMSRKVLGIFQRVFELPGKIVTDPGRVIIGPDMEKQPSKPQQELPDNGVIDENGN